MLNENVVKLLRPIFLLNTLFNLVKPYLDSGQNRFFHLIALHISKRHHVENDETYLPQMVMLDFFVKIQESDFTWQRVLPNNKGGCNTN